MDIASINKRKDVRAAIELNARIMSNKYEGNATIQGYQVDGAQFSNAPYGTRGGGLTGAVDSGLLTFCVWFQRPTSATISTIFLCGSTTLNGATQQGPRLKFGSANKVGIQVLNSAAVAVLDVDTVTVFGVSPTWQCVIGSFDLSNAAKRFMYTFDTSDLAVTTYTNDVMDFTTTDTALGAFPSGTGLMNGAMAEFSFWPGQYIDLSVQSNRRLFFNDNFKPVIPAYADAVLGTPLVRTRLDKGEAPADFYLNRGSGGNFTSAASSLTTSGKSPSD